MKKTAFAMLFAAAFIVTGCASQKSLLEGPFTQHSHGTFLRAGTGETGLYLDGENWCTLIDLHGFRDDAMPLESTNEFLVRKNRQGIFVSIYAEKIHAATDDESCQKNIYRRLYHNKKAPDVTTRSIAGRNVLYNTYRGWKQIDYCPFYKGYCFDFQFSMNEKASEKDLQRIIQSIVFVDDMTVNGMIQKIFYLYDRKLQMGVPVSWKYELKSGFPNTPTIVLTPTNGDAFSLHLSPYAGFEKDTAITKDRVREILKDKMAKWQERNADDPPVIEIINEKKGLYIIYFDVKDLYFHKEDLNEYPYARLGYVVTGNATFSFTSYFREEGRSEVEKGMGALEHLKLLDLVTEPVMDVAAGQK